MSTKVSIRLCWADYRQTYSCSELKRQDFYDIDDLQRGPTNVERGVIQDYHGEDALCVCGIAVSSGVVLLLI